MALPVLIIGKSGTGKSCSMRTIVDDSTFNVINVLGKPFPFRGGAKIKAGISDRYDEIKNWLVKMPGKSIVIDDAGYLITNMFMSGHSNAGAGNGIFNFYNTIGDRFWGLIEHAKRYVPADKIVYFIMHEDSDDSGRIKPKTIGKLLDEKVCIEGMFTIVLRCVIKDGKHLFLTQTTENDSAKTPMEMFPELEIDNDLALVDKTIREYYGMEVVNEAV